MKFLNSTIHGLGDYAAAAVLIIAPFFLGLKEQSLIAHWASIAGGVDLIVYSLLTDYAFSIAKIIPYKVHLILDSLAGAVLIALAFVLKLEGIAQIYMIVMGAGVLLIVAVSQTEDAKVEG